MADIYQIADEHRRRLLAREQAATGEVFAAYQAAYKRAQAEIDALIAEIALAQSGGEELRPFWLFKKRRLSKLRRQIEREMRTFTAQASKTVKQAQAQEIEHGSADGGQLLHAQGAGGDLTVGVGVGDHLNRRAVAAGVGFATDGSPLADLFHAVSGLAGERIKRDLITGLTLGHPARKIARTLKESFDGNGARALTVARTETLRAYREATRLVYEENADVLDGWIWQSARSTRTCALCWAMSGTMHRADETLASHPNCRCVMIPLVTGSQQRIETGATAFARLPRADQLSILGARKFEAYNAGQLALAQLVGERRDQRWGLTRYERSLSEVAG